MKFLILVIINQKKLMDVNNNNRIKLDKKAIIEIMKPMQPGDVKKTYADIEKSKVKCLVLHHCKY